MQFDNIAQDSGIGTIKYKLAEGYQGPETPYKEDIIQHTSIDGAVNMYDMGTRQEKTAEIEIILLDKDEFLVLEEFFEANVGERIQITQNFDDESIFIENFSTVDVPYWASVVEIGNYSEDTFSIKRKTFKLRIKFAQPVTTVDAKFNPDDIGNLNVLINVNAVQATVTSNVIPPDLTIFSEGDRWLDTSTQEIKKFSGANVYLNPAIELRYNANNGQGFLRGVAPNNNFFDTYTFNRGDKIELTSVGSFPDGVYEIARKEDVNNEPAIFLVEFPSNENSSDIYIQQAFNEVLYTIPANNSALGFADGQFYWGAFFTMEADNFPELSLAEDYVSGVINHKSIKIPSQSLDINKGPKLMTREGFTFGVRNNERFWKFITDSGIPLFGAQVSLSIYRNVLGTKTLKGVIAGKNLTNTFSYTDYIFNITPFLLNEQVNLPRATISRDNPKYANIKDDAIGDAPYLTYGQFETGALQNVSVKRQELVFTRFNPFYDKADVPDNSFQSGRVIGALSPADGKLILINNRATQDSGEDVGYTITSDQLNAINGDGGHTATVVLDTNPLDQDNVGLVRQVESLIINGDNYELRFTNALPALPLASGNQLGTDSRIHVTILKATYKYQMNEAPSGGFGTSFDNGDGTFTFIPNNLALKYLADNGKDLTSIPDNEFTVNADKNAVEFNLIGVNDPSQTTNFVELKTTEGQSPLPVSGVDPIFLDVVQRPVPFEDGSGIPILAPISVYDQNTFQVAFIARAFNPAFTNTTPTNSFGFNGVNDLQFVVSQDQDVCIYSENSVYQEFRSAPESGNLFQFWEHNITKQTFADNTRIMGFELPITHFADINGSIADDSKVVLGMQMTYFAMQVIETRTRVFGGGFTAFNRFRYNNEGVRLVMRVRMQDGTYRYNTDWDYTIQKTKMGIGGNGAPNALGVIGEDVPNYIELGKLEINNLPSSGTEGGFNFSEGTNLPAEQYKFDVDWVFNTVAERNNSYNGAPDKFGHGTRVLVKDVKRIDELRYTSASNTFTWVNGVEDLSIPANTNILIRHRQHLFTADENEPTQLFTSLVFWDGVTTTTQPYVVDELTSKMSGRDLFDLSQMFASGGGGREWEDVQSIQFYFISVDNLSPYVDNNLGSTAPLATTKLQTMQSGITMLNAPKLFVLDEGFTIEDRPIFSAIQGLNLTTKVTDGMGGFTSLPAQFPNTPIEIVCDIMERMFPGKTNTQSLVDLMLLSSRFNWKWRRQFIKQVNSDTVLDELMWNLWAVIRLNENDQFEFVSLRLEDYTDLTEKQQFNDSNILKDSITNPKFRRTSEIYQRFELNYNFYPVSDFSQSVPVWRSSNVMDNTPQSPASASEKTDMRNSEILYGTKNTFSKDFKYHYLGDELPLRSWVVDHFVYNSWSLKFKASIDRILEEDGLKIMDVVTVQSYFHTGNEVLKGFITNIQPNLYEATCTFTVFIPRPTGYLGPL